MSTSPPFNSPLRQAPITRDVRQFARRVITIIIITAFNNAAREARWHAASKRGHRSTEAATAALPLRRPSAGLPQSRLARALARNRRDCAAHARSALFGPSLPTRTASKSDRWSNGKQCSIGRRFANPREISDSVARQRVAPRDLMRSIIKGQRQLLLVQSFRALLENHESHRRDGN